jgi:hypothetical protein
VKRLIDIVLDVGSEQGIHIGPKSHVYHFIRKVRFKVRATDPHFLPGDIVLKCFNPDLSLEIYPGTE